VRPYNFQRRNASQGLGSQVCLLPQRVAVAVIERLRELLGARAELVDDLDVLVEASPGNARRILDALNDFAFTS